MTIRIPSRELDKENTHIQIDLNYNKGDFQPKRGIWLTVRPVKVEENFVRSRAYQGYKHCLEELPRKNARKIDAAENWAIDNQVEIAKRFLEDPSGQNIIEALKKYPENIKPTTLTREEEELMIDKIASSFNEWKAQDDWWTGSEEGVLVSPLGYDVNVFDNTYSGIGDDEVKIVAYALKERSEDDPDHKKYPLEADMETEIYSKVMNKEDLKERYHKLEKKTPIQSAMEDQNEETEIAPTGVKQN